MAAREDTRPPNLRLIGVDCGVACYRRLTGDRRARLVYNTGHKENLWMEIGCAGGKWTVPVGEGDDAAARGNELCRRDSRDAHEEVEAAHQPARGA